MEAPGEWTTVGPRKRRRRDAPPPESKRLGSTPVWRLVSSEFQNTFECVSWLETEMRLRLRVTVTRHGDFLLRASEWDQAATLEEIAAGGPRGIVLQRSETTTRGVLVGYPTHLPLELVLKHPRIAAAERCHYNAGHGRRLPTRQVQLTVRGTLPAWLDLGCWGRFACRRFVPEPIRCFRCQAWGHHQRTCKRKEELCGICSKDHPTRDCVLRQREGGPRPTPMCPNCGAGHHAWNRRCPARLRRIPGAKRSREPLRGPSRQPPHNPAPAPAAREEPPSEPRRQRRRRRRRRPRRASSPSPPRRGEAMEASDVEKPDNRRTDQRRAPRPREDTPKTDQRASVHSTGSQPVRTPAAEAVATREVAPRSRPVAAQATQTERVYTFSEQEMIALLSRFQTLVYEETRAYEEGVSHEPALTAVRKALRKGTDLPAYLHVSRPLAKAPVRPKAKREADWITLSDDSDDMEDDMEDLLQNEELTDEELVRLYGLRQLKM